MKVASYPKIVSLDTFIEQSLRNYPVNNLAFS